VGKDTEGGTERGAETPRGEGAHRETKKAAGDTVVKVSQVEGTEKILLP